MEDFNKLDEIQLKIGKYSLIRTRDGRGDSGIALTSLCEPEGSKFHTDLKVEGGNGLLKKGNWHEVGAITSTYFRCTPITKFIDVEKDDNSEVIRVLFRTLNSEYEVRVF